MMIRTTTATERIPDPAPAPQKQTMEVEKPIKAPPECVEIPTYLPSLYYKKYRLIEKLNGFRYGFPTMENPETNANQPIVRPLTAWDKVLQDVAVKVETMKEIKKYQIAEKAYFSRKCQRKFKKNELKKQEVYYYHRCLSSKLAERVLNRFAEFTTVKEEQKDDEDQVNRPIISADADDAFIEEDDDGMGFGMAFNRDNTNNLLDDLFATEHVQPMVAEVPVVEETIQTYMKNIINENGMGEKIRIRRSEFLNQIKECIRKRFKYKEKSQNPNPPRTGGAELLLNNLIKAEVVFEDETSGFTSPAPEPALHKNLSISSHHHDQKKRKRKEDQFVLNWSDEVFEEMKQMNEFVDRKASKIQNLNDLLSLYVIRDAKSSNYTKIFEKTLQRFKQFPRTLEDIDVEDPHPTTRVVDSCFGSQNQKPLSKQQFSIETLIDHFIEMSPYLFTDELDLTHKNFKVEVEPKYLFTVGSIKDKESMLFKFNQGSVQIIDQRYFSRENTPFGKLIRHAELFFLIEYYLSKFGNQWELIAECIRINPIVRGMELTADQIENLHNYYNMKRKKNINFSDKVILPFKDEFEQLEYPEETKTESTLDINQDNFEAYIKKQMALEGEESNAADKQRQRSYLGMKFNSFIKKSENIGVNVESNTFLDSIRQNMRHYFTTMINNLAITKNKHKEPRIDKDNKVPVLIYEPQLNSKIIKSNASLKRRKIINEKTSQLVGVLSKKKPTGTYNQFIRNDFAKREQTQVGATNLPLPPPAATKMETTSQVPKPPPKETFPTNKEKPEDKQKTPTKKIAPTEDKKPAAGITSATTGVPTVPGAPPPASTSRRRKPEPKPE